MSDVKIPICLDIDDHTPYVHVFYAHRSNHMTDDGRPLHEYVPYDFLTDFCEKVEKHGIKGKLSLVPMPCGDKGDILSGIKNVSERELKLWLDTVKERLCPNFDISPEMLTHAKTLNLLSGRFLEENEELWSRTQTRGTFTPYIARSVRMIRRAGIEVTGISSPWGFGWKADEEYRAAIALAMKQECGVNSAWYYGKGDGVNNPTFTEPIPGFRLAAVRTSVGDITWQTINSPRSDEEFILSVADAYISEDGQNGAVPELIRAKKPAVMLMHWQSLYSNGTRAGLCALDIIAGRINKHYGDITEWMTFSELMNK